MQDQQTPAQRWLERTALKPMVVHHQKKDSTVAEGTLIEEKNETRTEKANKSWMKFSTSLRKMAKTSRNNLAMSYRMTMLR